MTQVSRSRVPGRLLALGCCAGGLLGLAALPAKAAPPEVRIVPESTLNFGTFMVFGAGSRTVSASGTISDLGIVALEGQITTPARFTVIYDRGNNDRRAIDVELELVMSPPAPVVLSGIDGRLSAFESTLPTALRLDPGRPVRITLANCRTRTCSQSFQLGARLDVNRQYGGATLVIPIVFDATVLSVDRQNPGNGNAFGQDR